MQTDLGATEREKWNKCKDEQRWKIMSSLRKRNRNNSPSVSTTFTFPNSSGLMRQVYFLSWIPDISDHKFRGTISFVFQTEQILKVKVGPVNNYQHKQKSNGKRGACNGEPGSV